MLTSHADRACTLFAVDYDPLVGCATKLDAAAEATQSRLKVPNWGFSPGKYVFRDAVKRLILVVEFRRVFVQTLGLEPWHKGLEEYATLTSAILEKLGVAQLKRIGFQVQAYLPLGMSHQEMAALMPESYLAPAKCMEEVCGPLEDAVVQLHGEVEKMKLVLMVAPMTTEQAAQQFIHTPNLDAFLEPKLLDTGVKDFKDRIARDCFHVSVDLSRTDVPKTEVSLFLRQSLGAADRITIAAVQKLKSLRIKKG